MVKFMTNSVFGAFYTTFTFVVMTYFFLSKKNKLQVDNIKINLIQKFKFMATLILKGNFSNWETKFI